MSANQKLSNRKAGRNCGTCIPTNLDAINARYELHQVLADLEGASTHLERAIRTLDTRLLPPAAILHSDIATVRDRISWVLKAA
ncbi:hypothetical protein BH24GEM2_BH24GEM2_13830 [soil metagenome]